jgi:hypothetical protein
VLVEEPGEEPILYRQDTGELLLKGPLIDPFLSGQATDFNLFANSGNSKPTENFYSHLNQQYQQAKSKEEAPKPPPAEKAPEKPAEKSTEKNLNQSPPAQNTEKLNEKPVQTHEKPDECSKDAKKPISVSTDASTSAAIRDLLTDNHPTNQTSGNSTTHANRATIIGDETLNNLTKCSIPDEASINSKNSNVAEETSGKIVKESSTITLTPPPSPRQTPIVPSKNVLSSQQEPQSSNDSNSNILNSGSSDSSSASEAKVKSAVLKTSNSVERTSSKRLTKRELKDLKIPRYRSSSIRSTNRRFKYQVNFFSLLFVDLRIN